MLSHRHWPEYSWLPDLCAQKLSLPGTPYPRLFDYKSWGTSVALMRVQAPRDCKVDKDPRDSIRGRPLFKGGVYSKKYGTCWTLPLATHCHTHYHFHPFHFVLLCSKIWLLSNIQQILLYCMWLCAIQQSIARMCSLEKDRGNNPCRRRLEASNYKM